MISENKVKSQGGGYEGRGGNKVEYGMLISQRDKSLQFYEE